MIVKDIIKQVAVLLDEQNIINANLDDFENLDSQTQKNINLIISCLNEVVSDLASDYLLCKATENINVENGEFDLQTLSNSFYKVCDFDDKFKIVKDTLFASKGVHTLTYYYLPEVLTLQDQFSCFDSRLTLYAISYGVSAEFCLVTCNYSESEMWQDKFEKSVRTLLRNPKIVKLCNRRWC